jgi:hypothetical protein
VSNRLICTEPVWRNVASRNSAKVFRAPAARLQAWKLSRVGWRQYAKIEVQS